MQKQNLIFSRRADDGVLTAAEVASRAPAVFTEGHAEGLSRRYGEVSTARAVEILEGYGWAPTQAAQKKSRRPEGRGYAEHLLAFAKTGGLYPTEADRPEVVLYNSHDGSSSLRLFVGFYRFICSNGIVAGEGFEARLRHTSGSVAGFEAMLADTVERIPAMLEAVEMLRRVSLTPAAAREVARRAAALRWSALPVAAIEPPAPGAYFSPVTVEGLLQARRYGDDGADAWRVLNRVQEGVIRGGAIIRSVTERNPYGADRRARAVGSVGETVRLNRGLWDIVADVAEIEPAAELVAA